ncbi:MAG: hypothetical protein JW713_05810 [Pontiellaceae bacterium]|nr:hypothetical protein [Pontiellaceae bacterium]
MIHATDDFMMSGIGIVVDDRISETDETKDGIANILEQIQKRNVPCVKYDVLPPQDSLKNFANVSFILLDWELWEKPEDNLIVEGVMTGGQQEADGIADNVAFLKSLREWCFAPVFLFSHLEPERIKKTLRDEGLLTEDESQSFIFVHDKKHLLHIEGENEYPLFSTVNNWIKNNPSMYVLTQWKKVVLKAKNNLFWDMYEANAGWPSVLWEAYEGDGDDPNYSLTDMLHRNMRGRMEPVAFDEDCVKSPEPTNPSKEDIRQILEASMIIDNSRLVSDQYRCGDIFRLDEGDNLLFKLNIRCDCDCIARDGNTENVMLYLLNGRVVNDDALSRDEVFSERFGFSRPMNRAYLFPIDHGKCVAFNFCDIKKVKVRDLVNEGSIRIGRVTAPHVTDIRQRYSLWLQREGLPKVPIVSVRGSMPTMK